MHRLLERLDSASTTVVVLLYLVGLALGTVSYFAGLTTYSLAPFVGLAVAVEIHSWLQQRRTYEAYASWTQARRQGADEEMLADRRKTFWTSLLVFALLLSFSMFCSIMFVASTWKPTTTWPPYAFQVILRGAIVPALFALTAMLAPLHTDASAVLAKASRNMLDRTLRQTQRQWGNRLTRAFKDGRNLAPIAVALMEDAGDPAGAQRIRLIDDGLNRAEGLQVGTATTPTTVDSLPVRGGYGQASPMSIELRGRKEAHDGALPAPTPPAPGLAGVNVADADPPRESSNGYQRLDTRAYENRAAAVAERAHTLSIAVPTVEYTPVAPTTGAQSAHSASRGAVALAEPLAIVYGELSIDDDVELVPLSEADREAASLAEQWTAEAEVLDAQAAEWAAQKASRHQLLSAPRSEVAPTHSEAEVSRHLDVSPDVVSRHLDSTDASSGHRPKAPWSKGMSRYAADNIRRRQWELGYDFLETEGQMGTRRLQRLIYQAMKQEREGTESVPLCTLETCSQIIKAHKHRTRERMAGDEPIVRLDSEEDEAAYLDSEDDVPNVSEPDTRPGDREGYLTAVQKLHQLREAVEDAAWRAAASRDSLIQQVNRDGTIGGEVLG